MENVKQWVGGHEHVIQVCVWESRLERMPPGHKHPIRFKGTVVRSYKGKWKIGETIRYWIVRESVPDSWTPRVGFLEFLFLNAHTQEPIVVDTGESFAYDAELEREIQFLLR